MQDDRDRAEVKSQLKHEDGKMHNRRGSHTLLAIAFSLSPLAGCSLPGDIKETGKDLGNKLEESSRHLQAMTNQFGLIVQDYYGPDPVRRANAKQLLESVFGTIDKKESFAIEATVLAAAAIRERA
jgi:hypothetical protein